MNSIVQATVLSSMPNTQEEQVMSTSQAVDFIKRVDSDQSIQSKVKTLSPTDPVGLVMLGRELGYDFCVAEFKAAAESMGRFAGEMTEEELDRVAAGSIVYQMPPSQLQQYTI